jgi:FtsH-binding integral membrane protein
MNPRHEEALPFEAAQQTFMQRVYQWMAAGLAVSGGVALWASTSAVLMKALAGGWFIALAIGLLVVVFWLSSQALKLSPAAAIAGFLVYAALNGLLLSFIFLVYTATSIATTFFVTASTFAAVSLFGWVTKSDLTSMGSFLFMGLIGVIIASVVNLFFQSPALYWIVTYAGLAVFIGLTAYDTQRLKQIYQSGAGSTEQMAILGALALYLDFINMFLLLLRIFGRRR